MNLETAYIKLKWNLLNEETRDKVVDAYLEGLLEGFKMEKKFCGKIEINMFNGGIGNINVSESIKPPMEWKGSLVEPLIKKQREMTVIKPEI